MGYGVVGVTAAGGRTKRAVPRNVSRVKIMFCSFLLVFANQSLFVSLVLYTLWKHIVVALVYQSVL